VETSAEFLAQTMNLLDCADGSDARSSSGIAIADDMQGHTAKACRFGSGL